MESLFREYSSPPAELVDRVWRTGFVTFDSSSLLNVYVLSPRARNELLNHLRQLKTQERLWISHQAGVEFHRHRPRVARQSRENIRATKRILSEFLKAFDKSVMRFYGDAEEVIDAYKVLEAKVDAYSDEHSVSGKQNPTPEADTILKSLYEIFDNEKMVGKPYDDYELMELHKEGKERYEAEIPPGFRDSAKQGQRRYGDLIIWKQMIEHARLNGKPVALVTDDAKEDWTFSVDGEREKFLHPMLASEFRTQTQQEVILFTIADFISKAAKDPDSTISEDTVVEVEAIQVQSARPVNPTSPIFDPSQGFFSPPSFERLIEAHSPMVFDDQAKIASKKTQEDVGSK